MVSSVPLISDSRLVDDDDEEFLVGPWVGSLGWLGACYCSWILIYSSFLFWYLFLWYFAFNHGARDTIDCYHGTFPGLCDCGFDFEVVYAVWDCEECRSRGFFRWNCLGWLCSGF